MSKRIGKCINIGNCDFADKKRTVEIVAGQDFVCPDCGSELYNSGSQGSTGTFKWARIVGAAAVVLALGLAYWLYNSGPDDDINGPKGTPTPSPSVGPSDNLSGNDPIPLIVTPSPDPQRSKKMGIVELGATGFSYYVIDADTQTKAWRLKKSEFGASSVFEHNADDMYIQTTLRKYINEMIEFGVRGADIHFIVSSGASRDATVQKIMKVLASMLHYVVNTVTPAQEAAHALKAVLPKDFEREAFVVDIGSSNTKIAWLDDAGKVVGRESFGSKYKQVGTKDDEIPLDIAAKFGGMPPIRAKYCFIIGGVPFDLASDVLAKKYGIPPKEVVKKRKPEDRYTQLGPFSSFQFEGEKQRAGLNIYKAIADATRCRAFVFDWEAFFPIGFLLTLQ